ncbi:hypothetical protein B0H34DRAFT_799882 [Crassisporium funariophilum]|nr:hypothetical protein B0H34DRAFT_799882 [Crassisporium funariophilum]
MELTDFNRYVWRIDDKVPNRYIREAGGGEVIEDIWYLTKHGEQNLFLGVYLTISTPLEPSQFHEHAKSTWKSLRWEVPTIAASTSHTWHEGKAPTSFIVYDVATSTEDVDGWVGETLELRENYATRTLDDLRYDVGQEPIPAKDFDRQTFLYLVPYSKTKFGLLLRTSHTPFDGSGVKILMTKLLTHLTKYIAEPTYPALQSNQMKWGAEGTRLLPIVTEILRKREPAVIDDSGVVISKELLPEFREGKEYFDCLTEVMTDLGTGIPVRYHLVEPITKPRTALISCDLFFQRAHTFKSFIQPPFDPATSKPKTRRIQHTFSITESRQIKSAGAVGGKITEKLTVNHLAQGALSLLPLFDNPPPPNSDALVFYYGLVDGRPRLSKEYRGALDYPGYCLGMSSLWIPVSLFQAHSIDDRKTLVIEFAKAVRKEYLKQAAFPSLVAIQPQLGDFMLSTPPPPPWSGPAYSADGRGHIYLHPKYPAEGSTVIEITDFFIGLNRCEPGPFFRCTEWNGRMILSVDYNELAVEDKVVVGWLRLWADLLLGLTVRD